MSNVVRLFPREPKTVRGAARIAMSEALDGVSGEPKAVVVVVLGADGTFSVRTAQDASEFQNFDVYARAGAIIDREKLQLLE